MATKLSVFNEALRILGQPPLASPDANNEHGRQLRDAWEGAVLWCYEQANWNHTIVRVTLSRLADAPAWGYSYYYQLPTDFVRVAEISETGMVDDPLTAYEIENGKVATNAEQVYLKHVSSELLTLTPGEWSQSFSDLVSAELAVRTAPKLAASNIEMALETRKQRTPQAKSLDAIQNPPQRRRMGNWARAARGGALHDGEHG